jgi:hypothetical protein
VANLLRGGGILAMVILGGLVTSTCLTHLRQ